MRNSEGYLAEQQDWADELASSQNQTEDKIMELKFSKGINLQLEADKAAQAQELKQSKAASRSCKLTSRAFVLLVTPRLS